MPLFQAVSIIGVRAAARARRRCPTAPAGELRVRRVDARAALGDALHVKV